MPAMPGGGEHQAERYQITRSLLSAHRYPQRLRAWPTPKDYIVRLTPEQTHGIRPIFG